jgi:hypothetical protein
VAGTPLPVHNQFDITLYGFAELDSIYDTTQSFADSAGNGAIARTNDNSIMGMPPPLPTGGYAGTHGRFQEGVRNSRFGMKIKAPDSFGGALKTSAQFEMDFLGNQPGSAPFVNGVSENAFFTNPTFRVRHLNLTFDTPYGTLLLGQYWRLFGWQSMFQPSSVQIQGIPGEVYSRNPQIRYTAGINLGALRLDAAVAAVRPAQRNSGLPDGEAGIRLTVPGWMGWVTNGSTSTNQQPLGLGVSALGRRFVVPGLAAKPATATNLYAGALAVDLLVPILKGTPTDRSNAFSLTAEYSRGTGYADTFTGLSFGSTFPAPPNPTMANPAPTYPQDIDNGLVQFDLVGQPHTIDIESGIGGLQYYLPGGGKVWLAANGGFIRSGNLGTMNVKATSVYTKALFGDGSLFWDVTPWTRLGVEYAYFHQTYLDGLKAVNQRVQLSAFFLF